MAVLCGVSAILQYSAQSAFLVQSMQARGDFELIPTVKMETRHPVEESFGSEFSAICNHCGVMVAGSLKTSKTPETESNIRHSAEA